MVFARAHRLGLDLALGEGRILVIALSGIHGFYGRLLTRFRK